MKRDVWRWALSMWLVGASFACKKHESASAQQNYYVADPVHLMVPKQEGWAPDPTVPAFDMAKGGLALRLVRQSAIAGSPRFDVVVEAPREHPTVVEDVLTRNLQEMGKLETSGQIHINHVEQKHVAIGSKQGYRVHHEYTVGAGAGQVAINQVSTFLILEGRGVAITVAGRTELFHPLADVLEQMMGGLKLQNDTGVKELPKGVAPIDLGKVGGKDK